MKPLNLEVQWDDSVWTFNVQSLSTEEAMIMEMYAGTKPIALIGALMTDARQLSTKDFQCLMWLMKRRAGVRFPVEQTPVFDVLAYMDAIVEAVNDFQNKAAAEVAAETAERAEKGLPPKKTTSRTRARNSTSRTS